MTESKVHYDPDINLKTILWRYMDLKKFLDLLCNKEFYLRRADGFPDRLEGALFPSLRAIIDREYRNDSIPNGADYFYRRARVGNYVSCWTMGGKDSMALWQLYGGTQNSIVIATTLDRLIRIVDKWQREAKIYRVLYVDHSTQKSWFVGCYADVLRYKHKAYKHEREVRVLIPQQVTDWEDNPIDLWLPLDRPDDLISKVIVAPDASERYFDLITKLCTQCGLRAPVRQSKLSQVDV